jgi:hypothetical protein
MTISLDEFIRWIFFQLQKLFGVEGGVGVAVHGEWEMTGKQAVVTFFTYCPGFQTGQKKARGFEALRITFRA